MSTASSPSKIIHALTAFKVNVGDYTITDVKLGKSNASVLKAVDKKTQKELAVKILTKDKGQETSDVEQEIKIISNIRHPNLIEYIGYDMQFSDEIKKNCIWMFYEKAVDNLEEFYNKTKKPEFEAEFGYFDQINNVWNFIFQMMDVCTVLNENCLSHRDIKPQNILRTEKTEKDSPYYPFKICDTEFVKLSELSMAEALRRTTKRVQKNITELVGTQAYMSPELACGITDANVKFQYDKSDVYSMGLVFLGILGVDVPGSALNRAFDQGKTLEVRLATVFKDQKLLQENPDLIKLLQSMLCFDVDKRPTFTQLNIDLQSVRKRIEDAIEKAKIDNAAPASSSLDTLLKYLSNPDCMEVASFLSEELKNTAAIKLPEGISLKQHVKPIPVLDAAAKHFKTITTPTERPVSKVVITKLDDKDIHFAVSSWDRNVYIYSVAGDAKEDAKLIKTLTGHTDVINNLIVLSNGQLVTAADDKTIRIWDVASGECKKTLKGHRSGVKALVELEGGILVSGGDDKAIKFWDLKKDEALLTLTNEYQELCWSILVLNDKEFAASSSKNINIYHTDNLAYPKRIFRSHAWMVSEIIKAEGNNDEILTASEDNTIKIWNWKEGKVVKNFDKLHYGGVNRLIPYKIADKLWYGSCSNDGSIRAIESPKGDTNQLLVDKDGEDFWDMSIAQNVILTASRRGKIEVYNFKV
jgi:WD40 repeat protein